MPGIKSIQIVKEHTMPLNKKLKGVAAKINAASNTPITKNKKQEENDEFERLLADLNRATRAVGEKRVKQHEREEKARNEREEKHKAAVSKVKGIDKEFDTMLRQKQQKLQFQQILQQILMAQLPFLDAPNTDFHGSTEQTNPCFDVAVGEMQGWRVHMEDAHIIDVKFPENGDSSKEGLFSVFDGHSGKGCATHCAELIPKLARKYATKASDGYSIVDFEKVFLEADEILEQELKDESGCTAVAVHVTPASITCASVGDSRAVLCRNGAAFDLSHDHKPDNELEKVRIEAAGGSVSENRVNGQLAMSRAMGDFSYKSQKDRAPTEQQVIALPDIIQTARESGDAFVVVACDGIFDVLMNDELIERVQAKKLEGKTNVVICEELCRECLAPAAEGGGRPSRAEGTDNMTIMIVDLK